MTSEWFLFYGSLRREMENFWSYEKGMEYHDTRWIHGYKMYALRHYPYVVKTGLETDRILCELFRIRDSKIRSSIHELELSVGYTFEALAIDHREAVIYLFEKPGNEPVVERGDWVEFFGKADLGQH